MKKATIISTVILLLGLAACNAPGLRQEVGPPAAQPSAETSKKPEAPEADAGTNQSDAGSTPKKEPPSKSVFATEAFGILVKAPPTTTVEQWNKPAWSTQAKAWTAFKRPNGMTYTVLVYQKAENESFEAWARRSEGSDSYVSDQTVRTKNNHIGYVYESNDYGALPVIHISVPTRKFVYYFHWDEGLPDKPEEAMRLIRERNLKFTVPQDFLRFIEEIEVQ